MAPLIEAKRLTDFSLSFPPVCTSRHPDQLEYPQHSIRLEHIEDLVAVLIADYNGTPSACNGYRSPLELKLTSRAKWPPLASLSYVP